MTSKRSKFISHDNWILKAEFLFWGTDFGKAEWETVNPTNPQRKNSYSPELKTWTLVFFLAIKKSILCIKSTKDGVQLLVRYYFFKLTVLALSAWNSVSTRARTCWIDKRIYLLDLLSHFKDWENLDTRMKFWDLSLSCVLYYLTSEMILKVLLLRLCLCYFCFKWHHQFFLPLLQRQLQQPGDLPRKGFPGDQFLYSLDLPFRFWLMF